MNSSLKADRRPSIQDMADSAMHFLERRRSSDQGLGQSHPLSLLSHPTLFCPSQSVYMLVFLSGSIQPDLYRRRGSIVRNESTSTSPPVGSCDLKMKYDFSRSDFHISVVDGTLSFTLNPIPFQVLFQFGD